MMTTSRRSMKDLDQRGPSPRVASESTPGGISHHIVKAILSQIWKRAIRSQILRAIPIQINQWWEPQCLRRLQDQRALAKTWSHLQVPTSLKQLLPKRWLYLRLKRPKHLCLTRITCRINPLKSHLWLHSRGESDRRSKKKRSLRPLLRVNLQDLISHPWTKETNSNLFKL